MPPFQHSRLISCKRVCVLALSTLLALFVVGCNQETSQKSADAQVEKGVSALEMFDFDEAYTVLSRVQPTIPESSPLWDKATYALALAAWHKQPPNAELVGLADELLQNIVQKSQSPELVAQAKLDLGRIYEVRDYPNDIKDNEKARGYYQEIIANPPNEDYAYQAILRLAQTYFEQLTDEGIAEAIRLAREATYDYPDSPWKSVAAVYLGNIYADRYENYSEALKAYLVAEKYGFPTRSKEDMFIWRIANFADFSGQERLAMDYYHDIVTNYPRSVYGTLSRDRIAEYVKEHPDSGLTVPELGQSKPGRKG